MKNEDRIRIIIERLICISMLLVIGGLVMLFFVRDVTLFLISTNLCWGLSIVSGIFNIILIIKYGEENTKLKVSLQICIIIIALMLMFYVIFQPYLLRLIYPHKV